MYLSPWNVHWLGFLRDHSQQNLSLSHHLCYISSIIQNSILLIQMGFGRLLCSCSITYRILPDAPATNRSFVWRCLFLKHTTELMANATASVGDLMPGKGQYSSLCSTSLFLYYAPSSLIQSSASLSPVKLDYGFRLAFFHCVVHRAFSPTCRFSTKIKTKQRQDTWEMLS